MTIFTLMGEILLKDNGTRQKLEEINSAGEKTSGGLTGAFGKIGSAALKVGGIIAAGLGFHAMLSAAEGAQENLAQMDAVLKSTGDASGMTKAQLIDLADAQSRVTTFSKGTTMAGENLLLTFTGIGKNVFPATIKAAQDMSVAMGTDLNSSVMTLGKALNNPVEGMNRLTKQGVTFTAAQKEQITAMEKADNVEGAQSIILKELQKEFGGSAEAAGKTLGGQLTILKNQITSVNGSIGSIFIPTLTNLVKTINGNMPAIRQTIMSVINALSPTITKIIKDIGQIASNLIPNLGSSTQSMGSIVLSVVKGGLTALKDVLDWIAQHGELTRAAIVGIGSALAAIKIASLISSISKMISLIGEVGSAIKILRQDGEGAASIFKLLFGIDPMTLGLMVGIAALAILAYEVITHWTQVKTFFAGLWNGIKTGVLGLGASIKGAWDSIKTTTLAVWNSIKSSVMAVWNSLKTGVSTVFNGIKTVITTIWNAIKTAIITVVTPIVSTVLTIFNGMSTGISTIFTGIQTFFIGIWEAIKAIFGGALLLLSDLVTGNFTKLSSDAQLIWNDLKTAFSDIWNGIKEVFSGAVQVISAFLSGAWNAIKSLAESVWNGIKSFFESTWNGIVNTAKGIWNGFKSFFAELWEGIKAIINGVPAAFENVGNTIVNAWNTVVNFFASLPGKFVNFVKGVGEAIVHGFDSAINFIKSLPSKFLEWGKDMIKGLINGIKSMIGDVGDAVSSVGDKIRSILHFSVPDEGPLKDYETWMPDFMTGLANGIDSNKFKVVDSIKSLAGDMKLTLNAGNINNSDNNSKPAGNNGGTVITQNVTINSPKSLSPSETARQNKRMLQQIGLQLN